MLLRARRGRARATGACLYEPDGPALTITYEIDFPHPIVGRQELTVRLQARGVRLAHLARPAPSASPRDIAQLRARGLVRGGSLQNAVVLDDAGILSGPLRFRDEFVRHKIMDLLGDLALLGRPLHGRIHARKAGHALHIDFARALHAPPSTTPIARQDDAEDTDIAHGDRRGLAHSFR